MCMYVLMEDRERHITAGGDRCPLCTVEGEIDVYTVLLKEYTVPRCPACEEVVAFPSLSLTCTHYNPRNWQF
jgi:hypothetical protein